MQLICVLIILKGERVTSDLAYVLIEDLVLIFNVLLLVTRRNELLLIAGHDLDLVIELKDLVTLVQVLNILELDEVLR